MNEQITASADRNRSWLRLPVLVIVRIIALIMFIGSIAVGFRPHPEAIEVYGRMIEARFLLFGLAIGLEGSITALLSTRESIRKAGAGLVLVGMATVWAGFAAKHYINDLIWHSSKLPLSFIGPAILFVWSIYFFAQSYWARTHTSEEPQ